MTERGQPDTERDRSDRSAACHSAAGRQDSPAAGHSGQADGEAGRPRDAPDPAGRAARPPGRLARLNTGGLLYGTIVSAAALAVGAGRGDTAADMIDAMASTLVIYWLAHVYTATVSGRGAGTATPMRRRIGAAARGEATILLGGLPALTVVVIETITGVRLWLIVLSAVGTAIAMLAINGFLAGRNAGVRGWRLATETASAAIFGVMLGVLLVSLHRH